MKAYSTFFFSLLILTGCFSQKNTDNLYGEWKNVKIDYKGYQKFSKTQAEEISRSILVIEKNKFFYSTIGFIKPCTFYQLKLMKYDTTEYRGISLEYRYLKKDLAKMSEMLMLDEKGKRTCFNECSQVYLKGDTLINICGGYTFYKVKKK